jgi:peptide/nickel transport system ATP-binding protein
MFISHDISTVRAICDDILVLYSGDMVEMGGREGYVRAPFHPYTDLLIGSVPEMRAGWLEESGAARSLPLIGASADETELCRFLPRCAARIDGLCNITPPPRHALHKGNNILCHHDEAVLTRLQNLVA